MLVDLVVLLIILLVASVIYHKFEKTKDRNHKEELRETLKFTEQREEELRNALAVKEQRYKASMEFNSYFLNNYGGNNSIVIGLNSKHYLLHNEAGQAVMQESKKKFSKSEETYYNLKGTEPGKTIN